MKSDLQQHLRELQELQFRMSTTLAAVEKGMAGQSIPDLIDAGYLCRELSKACDSLRKAADQKQSVLARTIAAIVATQAMNGDEVDLRGQLATAIPKVNTIPKIPPTGSDEWHKLMDWIDVPRSQRDMLRPSFTGLKATVEDMMAEGKEPPVDLSLNEATVTFRKRSK